MMENSTDDFDALLKSRNCDNADVNGKLLCYPKVRKLLDSKFAAGQTIQTNHILRSLYDGILSDLEVDDVEVQHAALQTVEHFLKFTWTDSLVRNVSHNLIYIAFNEKYKSRPDIKSAAMSCIRGSLRELILQNYCDLETLCSKIEHEAKVQIFELFEEVLLCLGTTKLTKCLTFYYDVLIHQMYVTNDPELRSSLVKPTTNLLKYFKFNQLTPIQIHSFKGKVYTQYHPKITKLQKTSDPNWTHLWIFLFKFMGKMLFETPYIPIMNALLKNIENSFRGTTDDKLAAFDCWQTVIDNYSNDTQKMAALKQINLVLTPLRRILSREEVYVTKRFETFCHLVNTFQENSADVYLPFLLSFCFYTSLETLSNNETIQISFVRKIPSLREKGIEVLVKILGHYEHDSQDCVLTRSDSCIKLNKPLISAHNYVQHRINIKNAIVECALIMLTCVNKDLISKGIKCVWGTLFSIISQLDAKQQEIELTELATVIMLYGKSNDDTNSHQNFFVPILELFISNRFVDTKLFMDAFLLPLIKECIDVKNQLLVRDKETILDLIVSCINEENKATWINEMCEIFEKVSLDSLNFKFVLQIWLLFNKYMIELANASLISEKLVEQFMLFPVPLLEKAADSKKINTVSKKWGRSFMKLCGTNKMYEDLLKKLHNSMKTLGVFQSTAIFFLPGLDCFFSNQNKNISERLVTSFLHLTIDILSTSNIKQENILKCCTYITNISNFYTNQTNQLEDSSFKILCKCYELLCTAQKFENLNVIENLYDKCTKARREILSQTLLKVVSSARTNADKEVAQLAIFLTAKLSNKPNTRESFLLSKKAATPPNKSPKIVTLFGQAVEAKSPLAKESPPSNGNSVKPGVAIKRKAVKRAITTTINDENSENFVPINGGYVFEPEKLTEHQIEVLKKKPTDIPALYQDLTQSESYSEVFFEKFQKATASTESSNGENEIPPQNGSENETTKQSGSENGGLNQSTKEIEVLETELKNLLDSPNFNIENKSSLSANHTPSESETKLETKRSLRTKTQRLSSTGDRSKILDLARKSLPDPNLQNLKVQKELAKIKMDIVGGEQFTKHLNMSDKIQTRRSRDFGRGSRNSNSQSKNKKFVEMSFARKGRTSSSAESTKNSSPRKKDDSIKKAKARLSFTELAQTDDLKKEATLSNSIDDDASKKVKTNDLSTIVSFENVLPKNDDVTAGASTESVKNVTKRKRRLTVEATESVKNVTKRNRRLTVEARYSDKSGPSITESVKGDSSEKPDESIQISSKRPRRANLIRVDDNTPGNIPREPNHTVDDKTKQELIDSKLSSLSPELSITLVNKPVFQFSEDVIESSQDTFVEIVALKSSLEEATTSSQPDSKEFSPLKETTSPNSETNTCSSIFTIPSEDVVPVVPVDEPVVPVDEPVVPVDEPVVPVDEPVFEIKDSESEPNLDEVRVDSPDELIRRDLISDVIKSLDTAEMDTESIDVNLCSPATTELPTSPLRSDTPSRTKELMDSTIDISPIKTLLQFDCNMAEKIQNAQKLFVREMDAAASSEPEVLQPVNGSSITTINGSSRGAKLLNSIGYKSPMVNSCKNTSAKSRTSFVPALKPSRVAKMMQNCGGETSTNVNLERNGEEDPKMFIPEKDVIPEKDILKFVRPLPSPLASPRFGILKRRTPDFRDEDGSPPKKTRRVNFPDPPTTSEKLFFSDNGEENSRRLRSNETLFNQLFNEDPIIPQHVTAENSETEPEFHETEVPYMDTQGSIDETDPTRLNNDVPIFEDLVNCNEGVENILEPVTSAIFEKTLLKELNAKNIKSVGDLAKLSEREVTRLPFKMPKVETVRKALCKFKESLVEIRAEPFEQIFPGPSTSKAAVISPLLESESEELELISLVPSTTEEVISQVETVPNEESEEEHSSEEISKEESYQTIVSLIPKEDLKHMAINILDKIEGEDIKDIAFKILDKMKSSEIMTYFSDRLEKNGD